MPRKNYPIKDPTAPATESQLYMIARLDGPFEKDEKTSKDTVAVLREIALTRQDASEAIQGSIDSGKKPRWDWWGDGKSSAAVSKKAAAKKPSKALKALAKLRA